MGAANGLLRAIASSVIAVQPAEIRGFFAEFGPIFMLGGWVLLPAPLIMAVALFAGENSSRKPAPASLPILVPTICQVLAAVISIGLVIWAWQTWTYLESILGAKVAVKPHEIILALDALLFAGLIVTIVLVFAGFPAAMSALGMASEEAAYESEEKPAE
jgi:hypothetical protein